MGRIIALDQNMVNMIAAGEVIERPASVVKELLENSIDAGASRITVSVEDGGRKLISVADDGCGMDAEDLARAFEPHATSKIKTSADLRHISTLGFRGEALASIASVAQIKAVSRTKDSPGANCIEIDCGSRADVTPCSADRGTTVQVRDLFYKLPARRKFLKTANTEMTHIVEHFTRIAVARADLGLTLTHNGREAYRLTAGQRLRGRIAELFSDEIAGGLIEADSQEKGLHVFALLGKPAIARTSNKFQYVFLNGRFIRDKFVSHAIKEAYRGALEPDRFPVVFVFIQIPQEDVDVNVHPTKIEVRFCNANLVHSQILGCLREKLLAADLDMPVKLPSSGQPVGSRPSGTAAQMRSRKVADAMAEFFKKHRPSHTQQQFGFRPARAFGSPSAAGQLARGPAAPALAKVGFQQRNWMQIHDSFIIAQSEDGFIIIDQHALHERIIYEDLSRRLRRGRLESQKLLIPESFELTDVQGGAIANHAELFERLGLELAPFGPRTMAIQAFPVMLSRAAPVEFVCDLLDLLVDKELGFDEERMLEEVLRMAACKGAIKAGQRLSDGEIEQLLADREEVEYSSRCPHGRPTTIKFTMSELEKQFKRS
jgi:DNA mismatch repair protein MutL